MKCADCDFEVYLPKIQKGWCLALTTNRSGIDFPKTTTTIRNAEGNCPMFKAKPPEEMKPSV